jgi:Tfp pilus assembly protein PilZ
VQLERRCYPRRELQTFVDYSSEKKADAINISIGGVCIGTHRSISEGTVLFLVIPLEDETIVKVIGEVVWARNITQARHEIGIAFISLTESLKETISLYVSV